MKDKKVTTIQDNGSIRSAMLSFSNCYLTEEEMEKYSSVLSRKEISFSKDMFGDRVASRPGNLRLMFLPFMDREPFVKHCSVSKIKTILLRRDMSSYEEVSIKLDEPLVYIESSDSEIKNKSIMEKIYDLVCPAFSSNKSDYVSSKSYFEIEVAAFDQLFVESEKRVTVDDISIFFSSGDMRYFGDYGILSSGKIITNTRKNKQTMLRLCRLEGVGWNFFDTQVKFTKTELREKIIPRMRFSHTFDKMDSKTAVKMVESQDSFDEELLVALMKKASGSKLASKMLKSSKRIRSKYKNDPSFLLLLAMI
jgi:hypothetical protein